MPSVLTLYTRKHIIGHFIVATGTQEIMVHARELFKPAIALMPHSSAASRRHQPHAHSPSRCRATATCAHGSKTSCPKCAPTHMFMAIIPPGVVVAKPKATKWKDALPRRTPLPSDTI